MLGRATTVRFCSKCPLDLFRLFEGSFCDTKPALRNRPPISARKPRQYLSRRAFTSSTRAPREPSLRFEEDSSEEHGGAGLEQADLALKRLEKVLGRPIEDAIEQDQLKALQDQVTTQAEDEALAEQDVDLEVSDQSVVALRNEGADPADVAREARQVFGEYLPHGFLQENETKIYKRMYGDPIPEVEYMEVEAADGVETGAFGRGELLDESGRRIQTTSESIGIDHEHLYEPTEILDTPESRAKAIAESLGADFAEDEAGLDEEDGESANIHPMDRAHPLTSLGKTGTRPGTVALSKEKYIEPLQKLLTNFSNKQLKDTSERIFGGPGLPDSPLTPRSGKTRKQVAVQLHASQVFMGEMEANAFLTAIIPPAYAAITSILAETRKRLGRTWLTELLARAGGPRVLDAGAGGAGILAWNAFVQAHWQSLHTSDTAPPPPPLSKTVVLTGSDPLRHRSAALLDNTTFVPRLPDYFSTRGVPTLDDARPSQQRKEFDIIISSYSLLPFKEDWEKKQYVQNLWALLSSTGGVLILLEKGIPRGFEAIAGARDLLLERYIATPAGHKTHFSLKHVPQEDSVHKPITSMIVAPCTNHERCPMYHIPGEARGRKDFCSFQQRYIRPPQLQRVLGARDRNHDDVDFSYISVMKGRDLREHQFDTWDHLSDPLTSSVSVVGAETQSSSNSESWLQTCKSGFSSTRPDSMDASDQAAQYPPTHQLPRLVFPPIKRQGHILLDVCTPRGTLERWTVPRSFSKQAFRDARKADHGDLWALGAKTRIPRKVRVGGPNSKENKRARSSEERSREQALDLLDQMDEERETERQEARELETELDEWEKDGEEEDDIEDDIMKQVWRDMGVGEVSSGRRNACQGFKDQAGSSRVVSSGRRRSAKSAKSAKSALKYGLPDPENEITRQALADWDAEFQTAALLKNKKTLPGRSTKEATREHKRKYREMKRNGTLEEAQRSHND